MAVAWKGVCKPSAQLLDEAALPVDGDATGVEVLRGAALENRSHIDLVLRIGLDGLPRLHRGIHKLPVAHAKLS